MKNEIKAYIDKHLDKRKQSIKDDEASIEPEAVRFIEWFKETLHNLALNVYDITYNEIKTICEQTDQKSDKIAYYQDSIIFKIAIPKSRNRSAIAAYWGTCQDI